MLLLSLALKEHDLLVSRYFLFSSRVFDQKPAIWSLDVEADTIT
jgi:hypothetical protein